MILNGGWKLYGVVWKCVFNVIILYLLSGKGKHVSLFRLFIFIKTGQNLLGWWGSMKDNWERRERRSMPGLEGLSTPLWQSEISYGLSKGSYHSYCLWWMRNTATEINPGCLIDKIIETELQTSILHLNRFLCIAHPLRR